MTNTQLLEAVALAETERRKLAEAALAVAKSMLREVAVQLGNQAKAAERASRPGEANTLRALVEFTDSRIRELEAYTDPDDQYRGR